jgi:hypothetical protein
MKTTTTKRKELNMESDCIWVATKNRRKKEIVDEAIRKVMACYGSTITEVTVIQGQFEHEDLWHSHVWYNYETSEAEVII